MNTRCGPGNHNNPFPLPEAVPLPRLRRKRQAENRRNRNFIPGPGQRRCQSIQADSCLRQRPRTHSATPDPSTSKFIHQNTEEQRFSPIPSNRCGRCNSLHLANTHRELKHHGISLLFGLERLVAALEALEPDPAEMEWVRDNGTVFYMPRQSAATSAQNSGHEVDETGCTFGGPAGALSQGTSQTPSQSTPQNSDLAQSFSDLMAGAVPASAATAKVEQVHDLIERPPYCPDSCFSNGMWDTPPESSEGLWATPTTKNFSRPQDAVDDDLL